jgi:CIC family chloride channel protein
MQHWKILKDRLQQRWERSRMRLAAAEAVLLLSVLGVACGLVSGGIIVLFRALVEAGQALLLPEGPESYESLAPLLRLLLPSLGGLLIGLYLWLMAAPANREVGITHVIGRVAYHQGYLPLRNAVHQFIGGAISLISGHSVGREGPSIHLGATAGSLLGQRLGLPNNSLRSLVACGTAAAIGASFNTPLAGVAFAMEVVMMEYTITGFLPVILAAVSATALMRLFYGDALAFSVPPLQMESLLEIPYVLLTGVLMGALAAALIHLLQACTRLAKGRAVVLRCLAGGVGVGIFAVFVPEVMGVGYDTVNQALLGQAALSVLLGVIVFKTVATGIAIGFGLPGGLIGPTFVIGAAAGGALGYLANLVTPTLIGSPPFYALIGMGAMMSATLRAPLAALTAMLELTGNPNVIMPGMLAVVSATLICSEVFNKDSAFMALLKPRGIDPRRGSMLQGLSRLGVAPVMDRRLVVLPRRVSREALSSALAGQPRWILLEGEPSAPPLALLPVTDVLAQLEQAELGQELDLLDIPAKRLQPAAIEIRATLREALDAMRKHDAEALYVVQTTAPGIRRFYGVITRADIESQLLL